MRPKGRSPAQLASTAARLAEVIFLPVEAQATKRRRGIPAVMIATFERPLWNRARALFLFARAPLRPVNSSTCINPGMNAGMLECTSHQVCPLTRLWHACVRAHTHKQLALYCSWLSDRSTLRASDPPSATPSALMIASSGFGGSRVSNDRSSSLSSASPTPHSRSKPAPFGRILANDARNAALGAAVARTARLGACVRWPEVARRLVLRRGVAAEPTFEDGRRTLGCIPGRAVVWMRLVRLARLVHADHHLPTGQ